MAALVPSQVLDVGTKPTVLTPSASDTVNVGSGHNTFVVYRNTSATPSTVTIVAPGNTTYGLAMPDPAIVVPITTGEVWIPIRHEYDDGTGNATLTTSAQPAGLTCQVVVVNF